MNTLFIIILLLFILLWYLNKKQGTIIQKATKHIKRTVEGKLPIEGGDGRNYYVLNNKPNQKNAAELISEMNEFMINLIIGLKKKYLYNERTCFSEPDFNIEDEFVPYNKSCAVDKPLNDFRIRAVYLLVTRYRPNYLEENQPTSSADTSWAEGKGERIALCLREQNSGEYNFIDPDLIKFVAIHELTHIAANTLQHPYYFWKIFKFLLIEANLLLGFKLVDYKNKNTNYCGINVTYNPVYDPNINISENETMDITII
jgi:hypothetical protein